MNERRKAIAVPAPRRRRGVVVRLQSVEPAFSAPLIRHFAPTGLPQWILPALAGSEIAAALLFLPPAASLAKGCHP